MNHMRLILLGGALLNSTVLLGMQQQIIQVIPGQFNQLMTAILTNNIALAYSLIASGVDVNAADASGATPLSSAILSNRAEIVHELLANRNIHIDIADDFGRTELMWAVMALHNHPEIIAELLEHGADANAHDLYGQTVLMYAALRGNIEIISALLAHGADVNFHNAWGQTALSFTTRDSAVGQLLIGYNAH